MTRRRDRATEPTPHAADPEGLGAYLQRHLTWMRVQNYTERSVETRENSLRVFIRWCAERGLHRPREITKPILERYQRHLYYLRKPNGDPLSFASQHARLVHVRAYFKWLARKNHILYNPASELELPRLEKRLPRYVLSPTEVERVLAQPDTADPLGLRDRAILETLYSTGMRRMELVGLGLFDIDAERGIVSIRQGKGKKDRTIPIGERALAWVERYLREVRPQLQAGRDEARLFLNPLGEPIHRNSLSDRVRHHVQAAGIGKQGACHLFRHAMATHMLERGADIRFIQEMLGHASIETTRIYTKVSIRQLKEIHNATHPGACLRHDKTQPGAQPLGEEVPATEEALVSALAAEAEEAASDES